MTDLSDTGVSNTAPMHQVPAPGQAGAPLPSGALTGRIPGQSVISQVLALQAQASPRSWWGRFLGTSPLSAEARPWYQGAVGEIAVGKLLAKLGPEWAVLHAVPVGDRGADIDHVLIGPPGVFTLNTKNHSGQPVWVAGRTLMVGGQRQPHIPKAFHEATRVETLLSAATGAPVPVTGVLVLVGPRGLTIKEDPAGVAVVTDRQLLRWLRQRPPALTDEQLTRLTAAAVLPGTWGPPLPEVEDPAVLQAAFNVLDRQVRTARRRRTARRLAANGIRRSARAMERAEKAMLRASVRIVLGLLLLGVGLLLLGVSLNLLDSLT